MSVNPSLIFQNRVFKTLSAFLWLIEQSFGLKSLNLKLSTEVGTISFLSKPQIAASSKHFFSTHKHAPTTPPTPTNITYTQNPEEEFYRLSVLKRVGKATLIRHFTDNINRVSEHIASEILYPCEYGIDLLLTNKLIRNTTSGGVDLKNLRVETCFKALETAVDKLIGVGEAEANKAGLLNHPDVIPVDLSLTGEDDLVNNTGKECYDTISKVIEDHRRASRLTSNPDKKSTIIRESLGW